MTLIEFFTASRYIGVLEAQMKQQREDFLERLAEKNTTIRQLRVELGFARAEGEQLKVGPTPPVAPPTQAVQPQEFPQGWDSELKRMLQEEEDGIRNRGRIQEHQPSADDGA